MRNRMEDSIKNDKKRRIGEVSTLGDYRMIFLKEHNIEFMSFRCEENPEYNGHYVLTNTETKEQKEVREKSLEEKVKRMIKSLRGC